ncbi:hypothetical protein ABT354_30470 [Streptomyces sp. NPDC000594]|uniref:hypothetical protein n=1 Tax=Streptomyces sp. NPDC000594 TaxID=3154261 RepID=UPI00331D8DDB
MDAALTLARHRGIEPAEVWLHSGAARGYPKLGPPADHSRATVAVDELPSAFLDLPAWQVEDILCIPSSSSVGSAMATGSRTGCSPRSRPGGRG